MDSICYEIFEFFLYLLPVRLKGEDFGKWIAMTRMLK
jgi:hypothetical protein